MPKIKGLISASGPYQALAFFRLDVRIQKGWHGGREGEGDPGKIRETSR